MSKLSAGWYKWPEGVKAVTSDDSRWGYLRQDPFYFDGKEHSVYLTTILSGLPPEYGYEKITTIIAIALNRFGKTFVEWVLPEKLPDEQVEKINAMIIMHGVEVEFQIN